jgi:hypothetical protein
MRGAIRPLPQYTLKSWCSAKNHRDNFTFTSIAQHLNTSLSILFSNTCIPSKHESTFHKYIKQSVRWLFLYLILRKPKVHHTKADVSVFVEISFWYTVFVILPHGDRSSLWPSREDIWSYLLFVWRHARRMRSPTRWRGWWRGTEATCFPLLPTNVCVCVLAAVSLSLRRFNCRRSLPAFTQIVTKSCR